MVNGCIPWANPLIHPLSKKWGPNWKMAQNIGTKIVFLPRKFSLYECTRMSLLHNR